MKDSLFIRGEKVPMSKEEVRAISLSKLCLHEAKSLLDVGAGSGSIGIEACVLYSDLKVLGVECNAKACDVIRQNISKFRVGNYTLIKSNAPFETKKKYDRVFIGGTGGKLKEIVNWSYDILEDEGMAVCNFIIYENAITAKKQMQSCGFNNIELIQVMVNKSQKLGQYEYLKPINPVFILKGEKANSEK